MEHGVKRGHIAQKSDVRVKCSFEMITSFMLTHFVTLLIRAVKKECEPTTCKNGGTCTEIATGRHLCTCLVGYRGENCEGEISANSSAAN